VAKLIKCPGCGREVSARAESCPHCGSPIARSKGGSTQIGTGTGCLVILLVIGAIGYIASDPSSSPSSTQPTRTTSTQTTASAYRADGTVNIRSAPSTDGEVVGQLRAGDRVSVESQSQGWGRIQHDGIAGWVYLDVLQAESASAARSRTASVSASDRRQFREFRDDGIRLIGWVAGNARNHPIWPEVRGFVGEGGQYYTALVQIAAPGEDHAAAAYANVALYREWVERGQQQPFNEDEAVNRIQRANQVVQELSELMDRW
jgi:uncharacterized protein YraI